MSAWNTYPTTTTPSSGATLLVDDGGALKQATLDSTFAAMVGANYAHTLNLAGAISGTLQAVNVGAGASALQISNAGVSVGGFVQFSGNLLLGNGSLFAVDSSGDLTCATATVGGLLLAEGAVQFQATLHLNDGSVFSVDSSGNLACHNLITGGNLQVQGVVVLMPNLPIADPHAAGQLWNSAGTLKVSGG